MAGTSAYILIESLPGKAIELVNIIKSIHGVKTVHLVTGPYDVITFVEATDLKSLGGNDRKTHSIDGFCRKNVNVHHC